MGCRGDDQRPAVSSSRSILRPTAASDSITLRIPVTKPNAMEQRPLPDTANYSDPLRNINAAPTDGRRKVGSITCLVKEEKNTTDNYGLFVSGVKVQNASLKFL